MMDQTSEAIPDANRQLRRRNLALLAVLLAMVALFFTITIVKMMPHDPVPAAQGGPNGAAHD